MYIHISLILSIYNRILSVKNGLHWSFKYSHTEKCDSRYLYIYNNRL